MSAEQNEAKPKKNKKIVIPGREIKAQYDLLMSKPRNCEGIGGDTLDAFFSDNPTVQERVIANFCSSCAPETKALCLEYAILSDEPGILGGTTKKQRASMRRNRLRLIRREQNRSLNETQEATVIPPSN